MCRRVIALLVVALVIVAGCTDSQEPPANAPESASGSSGPPAGLPTAPEGDAFYQAPDPPADAKPGDLIWARPLQSPAGSQGYAIMYWSTTMDDKLVAVTGVLFEPWGNRPNPPRSILAWAHGPFGLGDQCAPSHGYFQGNGASIPVVQAAITENLVFVASDYVGLGTSGGHPFFVSQPSARSVLDSIRAAARFTGAGSEVNSVIMGQSQGGGAALLAAEIGQTYAPDVQLRASVAVSPLARLDILDGQLSGGPNYGYVPMMIAGLQAAYPELDGAADGLTEAGRSAVERAPDVCATEILTEYRNRSENELGTAAVLDTPEFSKRLTENDPGHTKTDVPVFIVHGEADDVVPIANSRELAQRYCAMGTPVNVKYYAQAGHINVFAAAQQEFLPYVRNRLAGTPVTPDCAG